MTTEPTIQTPTTVLPTWVHTWINLVKAHEKLVLIAVGGLILFHSYSKGIDAWVNYEQSKSKPAQVIVKTDETQVKLLTQELAAMQKQYAATIKQLEAALAKSQTDLAARQAQDAQLPLPELASRWTDLTVAPQGSITSNPNGTVTVTGDVAHVTVSELEKVPALTEQLIDTQQELKGCTDVSAQQQAVLAATTKQLADEKVSHKDDIATLKAKNRKSWLNGFKWGAISGFVAGVFVGHSI